MGYWEQIGVNNRRWRKRQAGLSRWRRFDWPGFVASGAALAFWAAVVFLIGRSLGMI